MISRATMVAAILVLWAKSIYLVIPQRGSGQWHSQMASLLAHWTSLTLRYTVNSFAYQCDFLAFLLSQYIWDTAKVTMKTCVCCEVELKSMPSDPRYPKGLSILACKQIGQVHSVWIFSLKISPFNPSGWSKLAVNVCTMHHNNCTASWARLICVSRLLLIALQTTLIQLAQLNNFLLPPPEL